MAKQSLAVFISLIAFSSSYAQCDPVLKTTEAWLLFDGIVDRMTQKGNHLYVTGSFNSVGKFTGGFTEIDTRTGEAAKMSGLAPTNNSADGVPDGSGGFLVFGAFNKAGDSIRTNLMHTDASGKVKSLKATINGTINTAIVYNGILYIGGYFTKVNNITRNHLAAFNLSTGALTSWNPGLTAALSTLPCRAECLVEYNGMIYVGGSFNTIASVARRNIAAVSPAGVVSNWAPEAYFSTAPTYGVVTKMHRVNNLLYICGQFDYTGGAIHPDVAAVDLTTGLATSWDPKTNSAVFALANKGDTLYMGGAFYIVNGQARQGFAAYSISTGNLLPITINTGTKLSEIIYDIAVFGDTLYLGGVFNSLNSAPVKNIAAANRNTGTILPWRCIVNNTVKAVHNYNNRLYLGGMFMSAGRKQRSGIARIDTDVDTVTDWYPKPNAPILSVSVGERSKSVYIGGNFTKVNDSNRSYNAAVDNVTGKLLPWNPRANKVIFDVAEYNADVYIGGTFDTVQGQARHGLARLDTKGNLLSWTGITKPGSYVKGLQIVGNKLFVGGRFEDLGGAVKTNLGSINLATGMVTSWTPLADVVSVMKRSDTGIWLGKELVHDIYSSDPAITSGLSVYMPGTYDAAYTHSIVYNVGGYDQKPSGEYERKIFVNVLSRDLKHFKTNFNPNNLFYYYGANIDSLSAVAIFGNKLYISGGTFESLDGYQNAALFILPNVAVDASISSDTNGVCSGIKTTVRANSSVVYGADYTWYVNGIKMNMPSSPIFTFTPANTDTVNCEVSVPSTGCLPAFSVTTNSLVYSVTPTVIPDINISSMVAKIKAGGQVTVKAMVKDAATGYSIEWFNKGMSIGKTSADSITYVKATGTDSITAVITPRTDTCYVTDTSGLVIIEEEEEPINVSNVTGDVSVIIYPNPFDNYVRIKGLSQQDVMILFDVTGRRILSYTATQQEYLIDTKNLKPGTYVLKIIDRNGATRKNSLIQKH